MNLPHAGTIASRIGHYIRIAISVRGPEHTPLLELADRLQGLLGPIKAAGDDPPAEEAERIASEAADLARRIVEGIETHTLGHDRLGQAVRNLLECLELGEEGAELALRAGEDPDSTLRG